MKNFYEVNDKGIVVRLNKYSCGCSANGEVVDASSAKEAANLYHRYISGEYDLKDTLYIRDQLYPYRNIIYGVSCT